MGGTVLDSRVVLKDSGKDFGESLFQKSPVRGAPAQHPESRSAFASLSCSGIGLGKSDLSGNTVTALRVQHLGLLSQRSKRCVLITSMVVKYTFKIYLFIFAIGPELRKHHFEDEPWLVYFQKVLVIETFLDNVNVFIKLNATTFLPKNRKKGHTNMSIYAQ